MSFYGKAPEPAPNASMKRFMYTTGGSEHADSITAQHVFFYESGHIGFWNDAENDDRTLVLAVKADSVWEDAE